MWLFLASFKVVFIEFLIVCWDLGKFLFIFDFGDKMSSSFDRLITSLLKGGNCGNTVWIFLIVMKSFSSAIVVSE